MSDSAKGHASAIDLLMKLPPHDPQKEAADRRRAEEELEARQLFSLPKLMLSVNLLDVKDAFSGKHALFHPLKSDGASSSALLVPIARIKNSAEVRVLSTVDTAGDEGQDSSVMLLLFGLADGGMRCLDIAARVEVFSEALAELRVGGSSGVFSVAGYCGGVKNGGVDAPSNLTKNGTELKTLFFAAGGGNGDIALFTSSLCKPKTTLMSLAHGDNVPITALAFYASRLKCGRNNNDDDNNNNNNNNNNIILLASGAADGSIAIFHAEATADPRAPPRRIALLPAGPAAHTDTITALFWAPPTTLLSASLDGTVRRWFLHTTVREFISSSSSTAQNSNNNNNNKDKKTAAATSTPPTAASSGAAAAAAAASSTAPPSSSSSSPPPPISESLPLLRPTASEARRALYKLNLQPSNSNTAAQQLLPPSVGVSVVATLPPNRVVNRIVRRIFSYDARYVHCEDSSKKAVALPETVLQKSHGCRFAASASGSTVIVWAVVGARVSRWMPSSFGDVQIHGAHMYRFEDSSSSKVLTVCAKAEMVAAVGDRPKVVLRYYNGELRELRPVPIGESLSAAEPALNGTGAAFPAITSSNFVPSANSQSVSVDSYGTVHTMQVDSGGQFLCTVNNDNRACVYRLQADGTPQNKRVFVRGGIRTGNLLVCGGSVFFVSTLTGTSAISVGCVLGAKAQEWTRSNALNGSIDRIVVTNDNTLVAVGGASGEIALFAVPDGIADPNSWRRIQGFEAERSAIFSFAFARRVASNNTAFLAVGARDAHVTVYEVSNSDDGGALPSARRLVTFHADLVSAPRARCHSLLENWILSLSVTVTGDSHVLVAAQRKHDVILACVDTRYATPSAPPSIQSVEMLKNLPKVASLSAVRPIFICDRGSGGGDGALVLLVGGGVVRLARIKGPWCGGDTAAWACDGYTTLGRLTREVRQSVIHGVGGDTLHVICSARTASSSLETLSCMHIAPRVVPVLSSGKNKEQLGCSATTASVLEYCSDDQQLRIFTPSPTRFDADVEGCGAVLQLSLDDSGCVVAREVEDNDDDSKNNSNEQDDDDDLAPALKAASTAVTNAAPLSTIIPRIPAAIDKCVHCSRRVCNTCSAGSRGGPCAVVWSDCGHFAHQHCCNSKSFTTCPSCSSQWTVLSS